MIKHILIILIALFLNAMTFAQKLDIVKTGDSYRVNIIVDTATYLDSPSEGL